MTNVSLQSILNANEKTQYYTSEGGVADRGILAPIGRWLKPLRDLPYINKIAAPIVNWIVKRDDADIYKFCKKVQRTITEIVEGGIPNDNPVVAGVVAKVNRQLDHIADKRPQEAKMLAAIRLQIPVVREATPPLSGKDMDEVENIDSDEDEDDLELDPFADFNDPIVGTPEQTNGSPELVDSIIVETPAALPQTIEEVSDEAPKPNPEEAERHVLKAQTRFGRGKLHADEEMESAKTHAEVVHIKAAAPPAPEKVVDVDAEPATPAPTQVEEPAVPPTPRKPKMKRTQLQLEKEDEVAPKRKRDEKKEKEVAKKPVRDASPAPAAKAVHNRRKK